MSLSNLKKSIKYLKHAVARRLCYHLCPALNESSSILITLRETDKSKTYACTVGGEHECIMLSITEWTPFFNRKLQRNKFDNVPWAFYVYNCVLCNYVYICHYMDQNSTKTMWINKLALFTVKLPIPALKLTINSGRLFKLAGYSWNWP